MKKILMSHTFQLVYTGIWYYILLRFVDAYSHNWVPIDSNRVVLLGIALILANQTVKEPKEKL